MDAVKEAVMGMGYCAVGNAAAVLGDYGVYRCMHSMIDVRISRRSRAKILKTWWACCACNPEGYPVERLNLEHRLFRGR